MKKYIILFIFIVVAIFLILLAIGLDFIIMYNGLVKAEKRVDEAKAQVEVLCQRRLDLIPNLIETVKAYAKHEKETLTAVSEARSKMQTVLKEIAVERYIKREQMARLNASESELSGSLKSLFALVERYPDLKASYNFVTLQHQMEGTENRISVARQRYNSIVRDYNTKTAKFPSNIVALLFGFEKKDFFESSQEALKGIKAKF